MATVNKDFKIKSGLIVEGTTAKVNNFDILTKKQADQDYIVSLIGGTATSANEANKVVKRDANGDFSAGEITADLIGNVTGQVSDISNHTTADLAEDVNGPLYFTNQRAIDANTGLWDTIGAAATAQANAEDYADGLISTEVTNRNNAIATAKGEAIDSSNSYTDGEIITALSTAAQDATTKANNALSDANYYTNTTITNLDLAGTYDALGSADAVQDNLDNHTNASSGVHGVSGSVVGTSDSQTLTNKSISDELYFTNPGSQVADGGIRVDLSTDDLEIHAHTANLHLLANQDITLTSSNGDVVLNSVTGGAYVGSVSAGNTIATNSYVDNAVAGLDWKNAAHVLYDAATPTLSGTSPLTIDGHLFTSAEEGLRVLVTSGNDGGSDAGIYVYSHGATWTLTRSTDADAFGELLGAAIYIAEGTQYGGTSWVQNNPYLTDFSAQSWTQFSGAGSITAGTGITVDGLEVSVDRITVDTWYDAAGSAADAQDAAELYADGVGSSAVTTANSYTDGEITTALSTAQGYANTAEQNAIDYADGLTTSDIAEGTNLYFSEGRARDAINPGTGLNFNRATGYIDANLGTGLNTDGSNNIKIDRTTVDGWYDASGSAATALEDAKDYADALDTDDIAEGSINEYFTNARAKASAADLLTGANLTNITITGTGAGLTITAENGVADSTTNDLVEGSTNKYFTAQRAVDALEAVVPNFTAVEVNSVAKQVAATLSAPTAGVQAAHAFAKADYRSAEYLVKVAYGDHTEISKVLLTLDVNDNIAITEYGVVGTNGSASTISAGISGSDVQLLVTTANNNSTVSVYGTLIA